MCADNPVLPTPAGDRRSRLRVRGRRAAASLAVAGVAGLGAAGFGLLGAPAAGAQTAPGGQSSTFLAQGTATAPEITLDSQVVDQAGVLSDSEKSSIESKLSKGPKETDVKAYLVYVDGGDEQALASRLSAQLNSSNGLIIVINTSNHKYATSPGPRVKNSVTEDVNSAIKKNMGDGWAKGGEAIGDVIADVTPTSTYVWGGAAAVVVVGGGGGAFWWSRKKRKQNEAQEIEATRSVAPGDSGDLSQQPTHALRTVAAEELQSTDESIRKGAQELQTAESEFGEERTRDLRRALDSSRRTLSQSYGEYQRLQNGVVRDEMEERAILIDVISSCGKADEELNNQAARFAELRHQLINAPEIIEKMFQQTVELRSRVPQARTTLESLTTRVDPDLLTSVVDNPDIAEAEIGEAEKAISRAREILQLPAGQQGGLMDAAGTAHVALGQARSQLDGVDHAELQLREAQSNLSSLIDEVDGEITEATQLAAGNAEFDRTAMAAAVDTAKTALAAARSNGAKDPLGTYSALLEADGELDIQIDEARGAQNSYERTLSMVDRTIADATARLQGVEGTIHTRGSMIGVTARSLAQSAGQALDNARRIRDTRPRDALTAAQQANNIAAQAAQHAKKDIDDYNRRNNYHGGGGAGNLITGLVLGSLLSGHGGFGGGFGGGGFGGGGGGFGGGGDNGSF
ncbi:TPM domain-containing protein [Corynebacterium nuruki]|uniref:TPM domain-containing protein n=1 Tax=Corynebacterium nuruki TaxID=1032851 RepID=UPI0039BFE1A8